VLSETPPVGPTWLQWSAAIGAFLLAIPFARVIFPFAAAQDEPPGIFIATREDRPHRANPPYDDVVGAMRKIVLNSFPAVVSRISSQLAPVLAPVLTPDARPIVFRCLNLALRPVSVGALARELNMCRRTLSRHCLQAGVPAPAITIWWCRLAVVTEALMAGGESRSLILREFGFRSVDQVNAQLSRLAGTTLGEVIRHGGLLPLFIERLNRTPASRTPHPDSPASIPLELEPPQQRQLSPLQPDAAKECPKLE
jgi:AraC-like DNA-binding protein